MTNHVSQQAFVIYLIALSKNTSERPFHMTVDGFELFCHDKASALHQTSRLHKIQCVLQRLEDVR